MREQEYRAKEKKVNRMSRDGLMEENLATGSRKNVSKREKDADFQRADTEVSYGRQSIRADMERHKQKLSKGKSVNQRNEGTTARAIPEPQESFMPLSEKKEISYTEDKKENDSRTEVRETEPSFQNTSVRERSRGITDSAVSREKAKKALYKRQHYHKGYQKQGRLQFDKEEKAPSSVEGKEAQGSTSQSASGSAGEEDFVPSSKLQHLEGKADKAVSKLEHTKNHQMKKKSVRMQRVYNEEKQKAGHKLVFEEIPKTPKPDSLVKKSTKKAVAGATNFTHGKVSQVEKENAAVEGSHKAEQVGESAIRSVRSHKYNAQRKQQSKISRLEQNVYRTNTNYQYRKYMEEHPEMKKKALNKFIQKQRIKKEYQKAYKTGKMGGKTAKHSAELTTKIAKKLQEMLTKNKAVLAVVSVIALLLIFVTAGLSSCSMMMSDTVGTTILGSWISKPAEIDKADLDLTNREMELQNTIDSVETDYPGYDEYRYNVGAIGHDPFVLINYLSAKYEEFTYEEVSAEIESIFNEMYAFSTQEVVETRTRTETQTVTDPETGLSSEVEVEVEYDYYILNVNLTVKSLETVVAGRMNADQTELYTAYTESKGGLQQFGTPLNLYWYSYISSYYGYRKNPVTGAGQLHRGVDIAVPEGTEVLAGHTGTVTTAAYDSGYGNYIVITDSKGYTTKYAHLSSVSVSAGQNVTIGQKIGETGNTGSSTGSHLHIEVLYEGEYYNPLFYFGTGTGTLYGEVPGGNVTPPDSYDDATVATLIAEAERYLGMPYTFGGTPPSSFDCSAFVCWAFTNSGVHDLPRTTAQGIYDQCTPVAASDAKAGDIIFFTGTYNAGRPVTHVGIYCGNGVMIHCGDPIQYASINTSYWQSHFYGFGRLN